MWTKRYQPRDLCITKKTDMYQKTPIKRPMYNKSDVCVSKETYQETYV